MLRTDLTISDAPKIAADWGDGGEDSAKVLDIWATTVDSLKDSAAAEGQTQLAADAAALSAAIRSFAAGAKEGKGSASTANVTAAAAMTAAVKRLGTDCAWDGKP
jgi:hypothetical protein